MKSPLLAGAFLLSLPLHAGELRGRVVEGGKPVPRATVLAVPFEEPFELARRRARRQPAPAEIARAAAGPDGRFLVSVAPAAAGGERLFLLRVEGKDLLAQQSIRPFDSSEVEELGDVELTRTSRVKLKVVGAAGEPVPRAEVALDHEAFIAPSAIWGNAPREARAGEDGQLELDLTRGGSTLLVSGAGQATAFLPGRSLAGRPVRLATATVLEGRVEDRGRPVAGALVSIEAARPERSRSRAVETDAEGRFRVPDAFPGKGVLFASTADGRYAELDLTLPRAPEAGPLRVSLLPGQTLEGRAVDALSGKPVRRARIVVTSRRASSGPATPGARVAWSDGAGTYRFTGLRGGPLSLTADHASYAPYRRSSLEARERADIPLVPGGTVSGRVLDPDGKPVAGAALAVIETDVQRRPQTPRQESAPPRGSRSGPDGAFRLSRVASAGTISISCRHDAYSPALVHGVELPRGGRATGVAITLAGGYRVGGTVKGTDGVPIEGAEVQLNLATPPDGDLPSGFVKESTTSGADGGFAFARLVPGFYYAVVSKPGFVDTLKSGIRLGPEEKPPEPVSIVLPAGLALEVVLKARDGKPAAAREVWLQYMENGLYSRSETTDAEGRLTFEGVLAGRKYSLSLRGGGFPADALAVVTPPVAEPLVLMLPPSGSISGEVLDADSAQPVPEFSVSAYLESTYVAGLGRNGRFTLEEVPVGAVGLTVRSPGYEGGRLSDLRLEEGQRLEGVTLRLRRGRTLRGHVTDAASGDAVRGANVLLLGGSAGSDQTDADGRFELAGLSEGRHRVTVSHDAYAATTEPAEVGEAGGTLEVRLERGGAVAGRVLDASKAGVADVPVSIAILGRTVRTRADGFFRIDHVPAGRHRVTAGTSRKAAKPQEVALGAGESREGLLFTLEEGATVRGRVLGLPADQLAGVYVIARQASTRAGERPVSRAARPNAEGAFEIAGVPAGATILMAQIGTYPNSRWIERRIAIEEGQSEVVADIEVEAGHRLSGRVIVDGEPLRSRPFIEGSTSGPGEGRRFNTQADLDGSYAVEGLPPGTYAVRLFRSSGAKEQTVEVKGDTTLDFILSSRTVSGTVVEAGSRRPLSGVGLYSGRGSTTSDDEGRFQLSLSDEEKPTLGARRSGYRTERRELTASDLEGGPLTIELERADGLALVVRDGLLGIPLRSVSASAYQGGKLVYGEGLTLDSQGRGELLGLAPGRYRIRLFARGYASATLEDVPVPSPTVQATMTPGGTLEIRTGPKGREVASFRVSLLSPDGTPFTGSGDGSFELLRPAHRLENLPPGAYRLTLPDGSSQAVEVREGQTTAVDLP